MCFEQQSPVHKKNVSKTDPIWCSLSTVPNQRKIFLLKQWLDTQQYLTCLNSLMPTAYCAPIQERVLFIHDHFPVHKAKCKIGWMIIFYFVFCNQGIWIFLKMFGPKCWRNLNPWKLTMWLLFSNCVIDLSTDISHNQDYLVFLTRIHCVQNLSISGQKNKNCSVVSLGAPYWQAGLLAFASKQKIEWGAARGSK